MTFTDSHTHRAPHAGELDAARKAEAQATNLRGRIFIALEAAGAAGLTPDEFCNARGLIINTVRRRFTDLWKDGLIRHHPEELHRANERGNDCLVWVLGADPQRGARRSARSQLPEARIMAHAPRGLSPIEAVGFARAIEQLHGITQR